MTILIYCLLSCCSYYGIAALQAQYKPNELLYGCCFTAEMKFSHWQLGEPSYHNKMCVAMSSDNQWQWKTADCEEKHLRFICQREGCRH